MSISLLPIISEFVYYQGLSIPFEQINQAALATSSHPQDNDSFVRQYVSQEKGWPLHLVAMETEGGSNGAFTLAEYQAMMAVRNIPQIMTLVYHDILTATVLIDSVGLRPLLGTSNYKSDTLFVGSVNFIRM